MTPKSAHRHAAIAVGSFVDATKQAKEGVRKDSMKRNGQDRRNFTERLAFK